MNSKRCLTGLPRGHKAAAWAFCALPGLGVAMEGKGASLAGLLWSPLMALRAAAISVCGADSKNAQSDLGLHAVGVELKSVVGLWPAWWAIGKSRPTTEGSLYPHIYPSIHASIRACRETKAHETILTFTTVMHSYLLYYPILCYFFKYGWDPQNSSYDLIMGPHSQFEKHCLSSW